MRDTDLVGRIGGEEFCVFMPGQAPDSASALAERIRIAVAESEFAPGGSRHDLSVSVGGVAFDHFFPFSELYRSADECLYAAKHNGRNSVEFRLQAAGGYQPTVH